MPILSSCGGIFCGNYVTIMLQHISVHGCFLSFFFSFFVIIFPLLLLCLPCSPFSSQTSALDFSAPAAGTFADRKGTNCRRVEAASWQQIDRQVLLRCRRTDEQYHEVQEVYYHHAGSFGSRPPQQERAHPTASQTLETCTVSCARTLVVSSCISDIVCGSMGNSPDWGGQEIHVNQRESIYVNDSSAPCRPSNQKQPLMFNSHSNMLSHLHVFFFAYASSKHVYQPTHLHDCILIMHSWRHRRLVSTIFCNVWCKIWKGDGAISSDLIRTVIIIKTKHVTVQKLKCPFQYVHLNVINAILLYSRQPNTVFQK